MLRRRRHRRRCRRGDDIHKQMCCGRTRPYTFRGTLPGKRDPAVFLEFPINGPGLSGTEIEPIVYIRRLKTRKNYIVTKEIVTTSNNVDRVRS